jgi:hypothetical protein
MENNVGSDIVTVRYDARRWEYDFSKNTVTEFKEQDGAVDPARLP